MSWLDAARPTRISVKPGPSAALPWLIGGANRAAELLGVFHRPMSARALAAQARRHTGLDDFGDSCFEAGLEALVHNYESEAGLNPFGRAAARWDTRRFLSNLLLLRDAEKRDPTILDEPIVAPIFITGMPRSGTTFLHKLVSEDPANRAVLCWETIFPLPASNGRRDSLERRASRVDRQLATFARLAPELAKLHPIDAWSPQECTEITAHVFRSLRFDTTHHVPSYRRWLDREGHLAAYRFHKRFLQHLQHRKGHGRWILKCPDHLFALAAVREVYPDACFVFMHRDPLEVLQSVARLTEVLRRPFARRIDRLQIGRQVADRWARGAAILIEAASEVSPPGPSALHLTFRRFTMDPLDAVATLYRHFDLRFDEAVEQRLRRAVSNQPNGGYGRNQYSLGEYGIDPATERRRYRTYQECFGV